MKSRQENINKQHKSKLIGISSCSTSYTSKTSLWHWPGYTELCTSMNPYPEAVTMNAFYELINVLLPFQISHINILKEEIILSIV